MSSTATQSLPLPPPPLRRVRLRMPWILPGYLASAVSFVAALAMLAHFVGLRQFSSEKIAEVNLVRMAADSAALLYWIFGMYRLHKILRIASDKHFPLSPGWAVVRFFIPIYSLFWAYKWPNAMARFLQQERPDLRINLRWPGGLVLIATLLEILGIRGFVLFAVLSYLSRRAQQVVELEPTSPVLTKDQFDLATSAGLGAGFGLVLCQAIQEFSSKGWPDMLREVGVVALVAVGIVKFIEPLAEWVKHVFHVDHHHAAPAAQPWILRVAVLMAIAFSSFSHEMLDKQIDKNPSEALRLMAAMLLVTGGITYAWAAGARCRPARACRRGLISGAVIALILLAALWTDPAKAEQKLSAVPAAAQQAGKVSAPVGVSLFIGAEVRSVREMAVPLCLWALFGLIGGLAIDRGWRNGSVSAVVLSVLIAALLVILVLRLVGYVGNGEITLGASAVLGWCLSLLLFPSAESLLRRQPQVA